MDQAHLDVFFAKFGERVFDGLGRALHIALEHHVQLFDRTFLHLRIEAIQADLAKRRAIVTALLDNLLRELFGRALIGCHLKVVASLRHFGQTEYTYRQAGRSFLDALAPVVEHGAHLTGQGANDNIVAHFERALLHQHGGCWSGVLLQLCLDDDTCGGTIGICPDILYLGQQ